MRIELLETETEADGDFLGPMIETRRPLWPGQYLCDMHDVALRATAKATGCRCSIMERVLRCTLENLEGGASGELACEVDRSNKIIIRGKCLMCELHKLG